MSEVSDFLQRDKMMKAVAILWLRLHKELLLIRLKEECCYSEVTLEEVKEMMK